jgi:MATE family multidrug resistance protein
MGKTLPGMVISLSAAVVTILLNLVLIQGRLGFPAMGVVGCGIATLAGRVFIVFAIIGYIRYNAYLREAIPFKKGLISLKAAWVLFLNGLPIGLQFLYEVGAFAGAALLAGQLRSEALAAHQIAITMASITYMGASGIATASTIRVGYFYGKKDFAQTKMAASTSLALAAIFMSVTALFYALTRHQLPWLFLDGLPTAANLSLVDVSASLLALAAIFQLSDGINVVSLGNLRGVGDVEWPSKVGLLSYWVFGLPCCYLFAFYFNLGVTGIWIALAISLSLCATAVTLRFAQEKWRTNLQPLESH